MDLTDIYGAEESMSNHNPIHNPDVPPSAITAKISPIKISAKVSQVELEKRRLESEKKDSADASSKAAYSIDDDEDYVLDDQAKRRESMVKRRQLSIFEKSQDSLERRYASFMFSYNAFADEYLACPPLPKWMEPAKVFIEEYFEVEKLHSTIDAEISCGFINFLSCCYCLAVIPDSLFAAGYNKG